MYFTSALGKCQPFFNKYSIFVQSLVPVTFKTPQIGLLIFQIVLLFLDRKNLPLSGARKNSNTQAPPNT